METYEALEFDSRVYAKLQEAERKAETTGTRYSSDEVLESIRNVISRAAEQTYAASHV